MAEIHSAVERVTVLIPHMKRTLILTLLALSAPTPLRTAVTAEREISAGL